MYMEHAYTVHSMCKTPSATQANCAPHTLAKRCHDCFIAVIHCSLDAHSIRHAAMMIFDETCQEHSEHNCNRY